VVEEEGITLKLNKRKKQLLLKTLIVRVLKHALGNRETILIIDNLQWCDVSSANALSDFMGSSDIGMDIYV
jgi:predicted ATPase